MNESDPPVTAPEAASPSENSASWHSRKVSWRTLVTLALLIGVVAGGAYLYRIQQARQGQAERESITRRESAPQQWKGFQFNISREQAAQLMVDSGVRWKSVPPPAMGISPWAVHVDTQVNGHPARDFSLRFTDQARWDYGAFPKTPDAVVDVEHLVGSTDGSARLIGINWKVEQTKYDKEHQTVPLEVLRELGEPHRTSRDITGHGNVYYWDWPDLKCAYYTIDSSLMLQTPEAIPDASASTATETTEDGPPAAGEDENSDDV